MAAPKKKIKMSDINLDRSYDARFKCYFRMLLAGPSGSGKTSWVGKFVKYHKQLMDIPPAKIILYYHIWQNIYNKFDKIVEFRHGMPSPSDIEKLDEYSEVGGALVIIDDQVLSVNKDIATIFTVTARHTNVSLIFLTQNLFAKQPFFRDISLQSTYMVLFKNPRDKSNIKHLAQQLSPSNTSYIHSAYNHALELPYSYLLIDLHQRTNDMIRLRTNIFTPEHPIVVYTPK